MSAVVNARAQEGVPSGAAVRAVGHDGSRHHRLRHPGGARRPAESPNPWSGEHEHALGAMPRFDQRSKLLSLDRRYCNSHQQLHEMLALSNSGGSGGHEGLIPSPRALGPACAGYCKARGVYSEISRTESQPRSSPRRPPVAGGGLRDRDQPADVQRGAAVGGRAHHGGRQLPAAAGGAGARKAANALALDLHIFIGKRIKSAGRAPRR